MMHGASVFRNRVSEELKLESPKIGLYVLFVTLIDFFGFVTTCGSNR